MLIAAVDDRAATAHPGADTEDVLNDPRDVLNVQFDPETAPGEYTVCVTAGTESDLDDTFQSCGDIAVLAGE